MSNVGETFFTSVGCMDGRVQDPIAKFGRQKFGVLFADTITEAGLVGKLTSADGELFNSIKEKILISLEKHHSKGIIVHGHQECAASDAVDDEKHKTDILNAINIIKTIANVPVIPVFVKREGENWVVEELSSTVLV